MNGALRGATSAVSLTLRGLEDRGSTWTPGQGWVRLYTGVVVAGELYTVVHVARVYTP